MLYFYTTNFKKNLYLLVYEGFSGITRKNIKIHNRSKTATGGLVLVY